MSSSPVQSWASNVLAATEVTFGTPLDPVVGQALEVISFKTGPAEVGNVRPKRDRGPGRGMQTAFTQGRVAPIPFSLQMAAKSRSAVDVAAMEAVLYKAAGLKQTLNSSTNAVYSLPADPIASSDFASATLRRVLGSPANSNALQAETLRGCVVKTLGWKGGDGELELAVAGAAIGKAVSGSIDSVTFSSGSDTGPSCSAADSWKLTVGEYYQVESEIIKIAAVTHGATSFTVARAQLSSSGASHSAKPMYPYVPTISALTGRPVSEATCTATIGGVSTRILSWGIDLSTGLDHLPGESGSAYVQGAKATRYDVKAKCRLVLKGDDVALLGKATDRSTAGAVALTIVQGTGTGGIYTFSLPYCEVVPFEVPDTFNDVAVVDVNFRVRDSAGNDALTLTLT